MRHARADYDRIQDPAGKIPADEPVFLLRGQDRTAPETLRVWADLNEHHGGDPKLIQAARDQAASMEVWQMTRARKLADL